MKKVWARWLGGTGHLLTNGKVYLFTEETEVPERYSGAVDNGFVAKGQKLYDTKQWEVLSEVEETNS